MAQRTSHAARRATRALAMVAALAAGTALAAPPDEILIPGRQIFPESITSAGDGSVYIGSMGAHAIYRAAPGAASATLFVSPTTEGLQSVLGVFADDRSHTLWACSNLRLPAGAPPPAQPVPAMLYAFDLASGELKGHYALPTAGAMCNDIAVGADGSAYATDTANMEIARLAPGARAMVKWAGNGEFGPKGSVLDGIAVLGDRVIVNALATGKLFAVPVQADGGAGPVSEILLNRPLARPDGMRAFGSHGLLVAEGGAGRIGRVDIAGNDGVASTVREGFVDGIVAVTVVGTTAYAMEGQFAVMRGTPAQPGPPEKDYRAKGVPVGVP